MLRKALALFTSASRLDDADFDPVFYGQYYPDLAIFKSPSALRQHYERHGKLEGRFPSLAAARAHFESIHGRPPDDFDVELYQKLNTDLAKLFSNPFQYELHYLEHGRFEDRPYRASSSRPEDAWQTALNLYEFNLLNESWLSRHCADWAEAIARMETEGVERLAPISRDRIFDPAFYRSQYDLAEADEVSLYRDWLHDGFPNGREPNETRAIYNFLGGQSYPTCFDWQRFYRAKGVSDEKPFPAKIEALDRLFQAPLDDFAQSCIAGPGSARLYQAIGDYRLIRGRYSDAAEALRLACASGDATARNYLRLGDALKALNENDDALRIYRQALDLPTCSIWALVHTGKIMLSMKMFREAMRLVEAKHDLFHARELFDGFVDEVSEAVFRSVSDTMHSMISDDKQDDVLDTYADGRLAEITAFIRKVKFAGPPIDLAATRPRRVAMLACLDLAQCKFYRVEQKRRLLAECDIELDVFDFNDPTEFMSALPGASAAIFYRVPSYPKIVESIAYAESLGIKTYFDIDDLVFTRDFPDSFASYEQQISRQEYFGLCHGVALYRHAISLCANAIVSTSPLADKIKPLLADGPRHTFVVPNGLDDRSDTALLFGEGGSEPTAKSSIFYGSGTKAHNRDFSEIVAPALLDVLAAYPQCRLVIVGYLRLDRRFDAFEQRISRFPFIDNLDTYWSILASCDINISVLHAGPIADCKSEIKWLEAAMVGVPSIVSATRAYQEVLTDGATALLARDSADWQRHLRSLIEDKDLRRTIGAQARALALREFSAGAVTAKLLTALFGEAAANDEPKTDGRRKKRILICNVFFAPQSEGGATRVVEENVEHLLDRYGDEFEISILSTFKGLKVGVLRVHTHRGCPVYRIGTPVEENMDWRPFNDEDILPAFRRVLEVAQPDLIHFHCIQRLTASIVEEALKADIPYVVTVHDAWWISDHQFLVDQNDALVDLDDPFSTPTPRGVTRPESLRRRQRLKGLLNKASATLAVSRTFADIYRRAGVIGAKACENGVGALPPAHAKATPKDKVALGHIGGRSAHKGAVLIEVVLKTHAFRNLTLLMIDGTLGVGEERVELWGTTPVTLRAPVERGRVGELYGQIDVLLAPSIWPESYGLVTREALFYRTWVVASCLGAIADDVVEGQNGFVIDPTTTDALAALLSRIDAEVDRFKEPPPEVHLRRSSQQVDEIVLEYRRILAQRANTPRAERSARNPRGPSRLQRGKAEERALGA